MSFEDLVKEVTTYTTTDGVVYNEDQISKTEHYEVLDKTFQRSYQAKRYYNEKHKERWCDINSKIIDSMYVDWQTWPNAFALRGTGLEAIRVSKEQIIEFLYKKRSFIETIQDVSDISLKDIKEN